MEPINLGPINREMSLQSMVLHLHRALEDAGIAHSFSGGLALAFHIANPRTTKDIDIAIALPASQAQQAFRSLPPGIRWGSRLLRLAEVTGSVRLNWFRGTKVDLFFQRREYDEIANSRVEFKRFSGVDLPFTSATDLAILKATFDRGGDIAGKERDWTDIRLMIEGGTVDVPEALRWVERLEAMESPNYARLARLAAEYR